MRIADTRAMVRAALSGSLAEIPTAPDPIFGVHVPLSCPDVATEILKPRNTWANQKAYDEKARQLARLFNSNFKQFADGVSEKVRAAGPIAD